MPKNRPTAAAKARRVQELTGTKYTQALRAEQNRPAVQVRPGDHVTFHHRDGYGTVTAVYPELKHGCPGIEWQAAPQWVETVRRQGAASGNAWEQEYIGEHWSYLADVATVNGVPTDYAVRYPAYALPTSVPETPTPGMSVPMQAACGLGWLAGALEATAELLPVPAAFHPDDTTAGAAAADGGMVSVITSVTLRLAVNPAVLTDPEALEMALRQRLADHIALEPSAYETD
ncbi:hypothetical protein ACFC0S_15880 [Streptomyces sp. NPDC056084]|uniref:hypothetical protein n=1 Tax=unclassified Streptomyces TaxID=2593676 RepID=UPI0035D5E93C